MWLEGEFAEAELNNKSGTLMKFVSYYDELRQKR